MEDNGIQYVIININKGSFDKPNALLESRELIKIILRILLDNKCIIFKPSLEPDYNSELYDKLYQNLNSIYSYVDFVFNPIYKENIGKT